jgi:hypothetical protein
MMIMEGKKGEKKVTKKAQIFHIKNKYHKNRHNTCINDDKQK